MWKVGASFYSIYCFHYRRSNAMEGRSLILLYIASAIRGQMVRKLGANTFYRGQMTWKVGASNY